MIAVCCAAGNSRPRQPLLLAVDDPPAGEVVGREFYADTVAWIDANPVSAHTSGHVSQHFMIVIYGHPEHRVRQGFGDFALDLDGLFLFVGRRTLSYRLGRARHGADAAFRPQGYIPGLERASPAVRSLWHAALVARDQVESTPCAGYGY